MRTRVLEGAQPRVRKAIEALEAIAVTGRCTVDEMRTLLGVMRAGGDGLALTPQPGLEDLEPLVAQVRQAGLPVELELSGERPPLAQALDLSAYRIVQEALTNTLKHAGPAHARVRVVFADGSLELEVRDDGAGPRAVTGGGHGLVGMRERVRMLGGQLELGPHPDGGFLVRARLPVNGTVPA